MSALDWLAARARLGTPGKPTRGLLAAYRWFLGPFIRMMFRPRLSGWENLPGSGPYMLVGNHSGTGTAEIWSLGHLFIARFGPGSRFPVGMAHPAAFHLPGIAAFLRGAGAVPATYEAGERVLGAGLPVLIFPGGDHEATRPLWQARRVDFAGRKGFLRIARKAGVPIVPMGIRGSHFTAPILWRSRLWAWFYVFPRLFGARRYALTLLAALGAAFLTLGLGPRLGYGWAALLGYLWMTSPLSFFMPIVPWTIRFRIGEPIPAAELFGDGDDTALDAAYDRIVGSVQRLVDQA